MSDAERELRIKALNMAISALNGVKCPVGEWASVKVIKRIKEDLESGK